ncbi:hypothetical protein AAG570_000277 [Ranatra chinensis]|uniref:mRNA export factor GLE1 n=1 Tax=Ranatra chinensis TaxID=642074 RepID=A0ABD0YWL5_9HEMI
MLDKFNKLSNLLRGQQVPVKDKKFSAAVHPLGIIYCSNLLAKKIVNQGEKVVSSRPEAAFPIASVTVALWAEFPDFGDLLLAHFHRTCPYLVPILSERLLNETEEEYFRKLGFLYENGEREDLNIFLSRMSGVMRLYCAMMVINIRKELMKPHVIGLWEGWRWCASFVNQEPRAEISATLLFVMLEVTGNALLKKYRHQFQKLLHLICKSYIPKIDQVQVYKVSNWFIKF